MSNIEEENIEAGGNSTVLPAGQNLSTIREENSSVTQPSYSPLTANGQSGDGRANSTGIFEAFDACLLATQSSVIQLLRQEMVGTVATAVREALSGSNVPPRVPSSNQPNVEWPRELPPV